jgi:hypothetical protein
VASRVLPTAILYDLLAAPFVFWLVARVTRGADAERAPAPEFTVQQRLALVFRSASAGAAPGLRLAGTGENYHKPPTAGRVPRLRLSDARAGSSIRTRAAAPGGAPVPLAGRRTSRLSFGGDLPVRTGQVRARPRASRSPGKNWLRGATGAYLAGSPALKAQAAAARRAGRGPGRGWLTAAGAAGLAVPSARRVSRGPGKGWITAGSLAGPSAKRAGRGLGRGWITAGSLARPAGTGASRGPGKGWITAGSLAGPAARRAARGPGRGWLNAARPGGGGLAGPGRPRSAADALAARSAPSGVSALSGSGTPMASRGPRGRRAIRASAFRGTRAYQGNWYTAAPSGEWLRRSRHPWRKRSQRLLRLVGVGK